MVEYTKDELKKLFYKGRDGDKFIAELVRMRKGMAYYVCYVDYGGDQVQAVHFNIPFSEMGDDTFEPTMEAKYLIAWML